MEQKRYNDFVIVCSSAYKEIRHQLILRGLRENQDFFDYFFFVQIFMIYSKQRLWIRRCEWLVRPDMCGCTNIVSALFSEAERWFSLADYTENFSLHFDEHISAKDTIMLISRVFDHFRERMEHARVFIPFGLLSYHQMRSLLDRYAIEITAVLPETKEDISKKVIWPDEELQVLNRKARFIYNREDWIGVAEYENIDNFGAKEWFGGCRSDFCGLYRNCLYYCMAELSAILKDDIADDPNDAFDLSGEVDKMALLEFLCGYSKRGYLSYCGICKGDIRKSSIDMVNGMREEGTV